MADPLEVSMARLLACASGMMVAVACSPGADGDGTRQGGRIAGAAGEASGAGAAGVASPTGGAHDPDGGWLTVPDPPEEEPPERFFLDDPPPQSCSGGGLPVSPGGTPECPNDKNYRGCPCPTEGVQAPCWPGLRKHQNRGDCRDGVTTCGRRREVELQWGPCEGFEGLDPETLLPLGTTGRAACGCFSSGFWDIANTSPCFACQDPSCNTVVGAYNTVLVSTSPPEAACAPTQPNFGGSPSPPPEPFSTNAVEADCTGFFRLCYTFKAVAAPGAEQSSETDCVMKQVCTEAHYDVAGEMQPFPDLPGWATDTPSEVECAQRFRNNGGYAEMSVTGESDECEPIDKIFQTFTYCPFTCNDPADPAYDPDVCDRCTTGGGGRF